MPRLRRYLIALAALTLTVQSVAVGQAEDPRPHGPITVSIDGASLASAIETLATAAGSRLSCADPLIAHRPIVLFAGGQRANELMDAIAEFATTAPGECRWMRMPS